MLYPELYMLFMFIATILNCTMLLQLQGAWDRNTRTNAGINLTGYHPPRAPRGFCTEMCAQPQGFCKTENAQGAGLKMTMSLGPGICIYFISNMKIVNTVIWA